MSVGSGSSWAFWAGKTDDSTASFYVRHDGVLYAKNATIEGTITAKTTTKEGRNEYIATFGTNSNTTFLGTSFEGSITSTGQTSNPPVGKIKIGLNNSSTLGNNQGVITCEDMPGGLFICNKTQYSKLNNWASGMLEIRSQESTIPNYYPVIYMQHTKSQGFGFFIGFKQKDPRGTNQVWYTGYGGLMSEDGESASANRIYQSDSPFEQKG